MKPARRGPRSKSRTRTLPIAKPAEETGRRFEKELGILVAGDIVNPKGLRGKYAFKYATYEGDRLLWVTLYGPWILKRGAKPKLSEQAQYESVSLDQIANQI